MTISPVLGARGIFPRWLLAHTRRLLQELGHVGKKRLPTLTGANSTTSLTIHLMKLVLTVDRFRTATPLPFRSAKPWALISTAPFEPLEFAECFPAGGETCSTQHMIAM